MIEFQNEVSRNPAAVVRLSNPSYSRSNSREIYILFFRVEQAGLGERGAHRQPQVCSTVPLQIQTGSFGEPPSPSSSDLSLELDQY
jgi:hypothetical protein